MSRQYLSQEGERLVRRQGGEILWVEPWGENSLRVRATRQRAIETSEDWALEPPAASAAEITVDGDSASITNGRITATIDRYGILEFTNQRGDLLLREYWQVLDAGAETSSIAIPGRAYKPVLGSDDCELTVSFQPQAAERIYGLGQRQIAELDMKGCTLELAHRNSQASIPFALSSRGYGFLWNNPAIGRVTFGKNVTEWHAARTGQLDYWITAGDTPAQVEEAYATATGKTPMMPDWATGFWQCKLRYSTQDELLAVAREYKRRELPISVIVADFFHWPQQGEWKFDPQYWPDPDAMIAELRELGIELMVSIWPTVDVNSGNYDEMEDRGLLVRTDRGAGTQMEFMGNEVFFDATNPAAQEFVWARAKENYFDKGVRVFWLDEAEPELVTHSGKYDWDVIRYSAGPALKVGNLYPVGYARGFYEGQRAAGQDEVCNLIRCCWAGSQKYATLLWSGDVHSTFESFRMQFAAGLNAGISGIPWWTTDIGGFTGGNGEDPQFRELLVRWFQWGVFCPVTRLHGFREPYEFTGEATWRTFNGVLGSGAANEVWSYGEDVYQILAGCLRTREALRPYVTEQMTAAHERGTPVIRPLFYDFPADTHAWDIEDQYLFGPDVLVAPILAYGLRERPVYLPAGRSWVDVASGQAYEGGQTVTVAAPLETIPLFATAGSGVLDVLSGRG
ncbi:MAG TPA: glycoside hydrolase family 31 protein [Streptosporangiaceae bacterium]|nr:glycoside hydrolase family 31 protein [Streptosporangiaceae bacterium]